MLGCCAFRRGFIPHGPFSPTDITKYDMDTWLQPVCEMNWWFCSYLKHIRFQEQYVIFNVLSLSVDTPSAATLFTNVANKSCLTCPNISHVWHLDVRNITDNTYTGFFVKHVNMWIQGFLFNACLVCVSTLWSTLCSKLHIIRINNVHR